MTLEQIAHRYDLDAKRISNWKAKFGSGAAFVPVEVSADDDNVANSAQQSSSCIEIDLPCGTRVRWHADANAGLVADAIATVRSKR
ncbi:MAG: hypothetical protein ACR2OV_07935 [Hyphomicrobiaceae bacterium]